jgi:glycosyltransferase involved in cell wall biosynthesis
MAKQSSKFVCQECGGQSPQWLGKCPHCGKFGTMVEEFDEPIVEVKGSIAVSPSKPTLLKDIKKENYERIKTGFKELDTVLGGGIVPKTQEEFVQSLERLASDDEYRRSLGDEGRSEACEKYKISKKVEQLESILYSLTSKK